MQQFLSVQARPVAACYLGESPHRRVAEVRGSEVTYWGQRTVSLTPGTKSTLRRAIQS
jgi:hypothetical protein